MKKEELLGNIRDYFSDLNDHEIEERIPELIAFIEKSKQPSDYTREELTDELNRRGWNFHPWCEEDVQVAVDDHFEDDERLIDNPLNDDDIRIILNNVFDNHDSKKGR